MAARTGHAKDQMIMETMKTRNASALIELPGVIAISAILASLSLLARGRAKAGAQVLQDLQALQEAIPQ